MIYVLNATFIYLYKNPIQMTTNKSTVIIKDEKIERLKSSILQAASYLDNNSFDQAYQIIREAFMD